MATGYDRADVTNDIADGNVINAEPLDLEFDALAAAFNATTGHNHNGDAANGGPITVTGPVQDFVFSATKLEPKTDDTYDLGSTVKKFKDLYIDGVAYVDAIEAGTADINGGTIDNAVIGATTPAAGTFTTLASTSLTTTTLTATNATISGTLSSATLNGCTIDASSNTVTNVSLTAGVTGTLPVANGGTGLTTFTAANNALYSSGAGALTAGTLPVAAGGTGLTTFTAANNALYSSGAGALTAGTLPVAAGGTGAATLTSNSLVVGNGTSPVQFIAPGAEGNVLTSNGTTWASTPITGGVNVVSPGDTLPSNSGLYVLNATGTMIVPALSPNSDIILGTMTTFNIYAKSAVDDWNIAFRSTLGNQALIVPRTTAVPRGIWQQMSPPPITTLDRGSTYAGTSGILGVAVLDADRTLLVTSTPTGGMNFDFLIYDSTTDTFGSAVNSTLTGTSGPTICGFSNNGSGSTVMWYYTTGTTDIHAVVITHSGTTVSAVGTGVSIADNSTLTSSFYLVKMSDDNYFTCTNTGGTTQFRKVTISGTTVTSTASGAVPFTISGTSTVALSKCTSDTVLVTAWNSGSSVYTSVVYTFSTNTFGTGLNSTGFTAASGLAHLFCYGEGSDSYHLAVVPTSTSNTWAYYVVRANGTTVTQSAVTTETLRPEVQNNFVVGGVSPYERTPLLNSRFVFTATSSSEILLLQNNVGSANERVAKVITQNGTASAPTLGTGLTIYSTASSTGYLRRDTSGSSAIYFTNAASFLAKLSVSGTTVSTSFSGVSLAGNSDYIFSDELTTVARKNASTYYLSTLTTMIRESIFATTENQYTLTTTLADPYKVLYTSNTSGFVSRYFVTGEIS